MTGLDLDEDGDCFLLKVTSKDGVSTNVKLTSEQLVTLAQSAPLFQQRILARCSRPEAGVEAVYSTRVEEVILNTDLLKEKILLTFAMPNGAKLVYALTPLLANNLVQRLPQKILEVLDQLPPEQ